MYRLSCLRKSIHRSSGIWSIDHRHICIVVVDHHSSSSSSSRDYFLSLALVDNDLRGLMLRSSSIRSSSSINNPIYYPPLTLIFLHAHLRILFLMLLPILFSPIITNITSLAPR